MKKIILVYIFLLLTSCSKDEVKVIENKNTIENKSTENTIENKSTESRVNSSTGETSSTGKTSSSGEINQTEVNCETSYNDLLKKHSKNYTDCYYEKPNNSDCEIGKNGESKINLAIIFDDSGSMAEKTSNGETRMELAKEQLAEYISNLDKETKIAFILYGHKGNGTDAGRNASCEGIEVIKNFTDNNMGDLTSKIKELAPNGRTPIAKSLELAGETLKKQSKENDKNIVLLVSDGKESCGGNPVKIAGEISKNKNTYVDVIGLDVEGETQKELIDIAKNGKGNYFDVKNKIDFEKTFNQTKNFLNGLSCGASKSSIELSYGAEAINKYFSCMQKLKEESTYIIVDSPEKCRDEIITKVKEKEDKYSVEFEKMKNKGEDILNNFTKSIEKVEDDLSNQGD